MLKKLLAVSLVAILGTLMSGCVVVGAGIGAIIVDGADKDLTARGGVVEVGEIKTMPGTNISLVKAANVSSVVFQKDMTTPNALPEPSDAKINAAVTEEVKRSLGLFEKASSSAVIRLKTFYYESGWGFNKGTYYYRAVTERDTLSFVGKDGVNKAVNTHLTLEQGNNILLEVHGLWAGGNQSDEIAGAKQLAREMVSEVLKKLSAASAPPRESVAEAEAKKE